MADADDAYQFDRQKFLAAVHFVCARHQPPDLGKFKLHKTLFIAELLNFLEEGRPLCGADYERQQAGAVARQLQWAVRELIDAGKLRVEERNIAGYPKVDYISAVAPNGMALSDDERQLLSEVSDYVCGRGAIELSELDYEAAVQVVRPGERIPMWAALSLVPAEVTQDDIDWAAAEAKRIGLLES